MLVQPFENHLTQVEAIGESYMSAQNAISLWDASALERDYHAPLDSNVTVDVAIVGGGFTGLSTALHCAEKGLTAHVVEAEQIGFGGSGRNCGLVNAALWLPPQKVREKLGPVYGPRFIKKFGDGPEYVFALIEKHQMQCEVTKTGTIHAAHNPSGFEELRERHKEWQRLGQPVDLVSRDEVSDMIGTRHFHGGLVDNRCGTINPMGYCRGLARAALGAGAKISTGVRATKLRKDGDLWTVETDQGSITAKAVVLGTNAYTDDLWPNLKRIFTMIHYFQLATKPMGADATHILPGKQGLWDTGQIMFNIRRDAFDRLLVGSMGKVMGSKDRGLSHRWARKQIARIFPSLGPVEFNEAWHGQIAMTPDHLPRIYELDTNLFTPIGYNGRGITTGTMFGETMAGLLTGMDREDLPLPMTELSTVPSAPIVSRVYQSAFTANQILKAI
ncbi:MAG: NAD(P)/FAD-dependent oxidoreductase [Planktomarina sp.]